MAITERRDDYAVYSTGWLHRDNNAASNGRPHDLNGMVKNKGGLAYVSVAYMGRMGGPWEQSIIAETVRNGRSLTLSQRRTERDWLTERGIKTVVGRWLRELD